MITARPATVEDAAEFGWAVSMRGYAVERDGKVVGLYGLYYDHDTAIVFTSTKPELREDKPAMLIGLRHVLRFLKELTVPALAVASDKEPEAPSLLQKIGFIPLGEINGREVFQWARR